MTFHPSRNELPERSKVASLFIWKLTKRENPKII